VDCSPGGVSSARSHAKSPVIDDYVASGVIETQVEGERRRVVRAGKSFHELPGTHHVISGNASAKEPMGLPAIFAANSVDRTQTTPDN